MSIREVYSSKPCDVCGCPFQDIVIRVDLIG